MCACVCAGVELAAEAEAEGTGSPNTSGSAQSSEGIECGVVGDSFAWAWKYCGEGCGGGEPSESLALPSSEPELERGGVDIGGDGAPPPSELIEPLALVLLEQRVTTADSSSVNTFASVVEGIIDTSANMSDSQRPGNVKVAI